MLILISPAKRLDFSPAPVELPRTPPRLAEETEKLARVTKRLKPADLAALMDLSDDLATLNHARFQALDARASGAEALQAALAFAGDVYQGLKARELGPDDFRWAQDHVRILSGLYGLLRPLDLIAPHRLEMGTRLKTRRGANLHDFWGPRIAKLAAADLDGHAHRVIVNLASVEYFGAVDKKALKARVVTCHFKEIDAQGARVISFNAKLARGLMTRHAIDHRIEDPEELKGFDREGYRFVPDLSNPDEWTFARPRRPAGAGVGAAR
jgi:cytoplasmic iron level regulating protein YaaA (DUF328/UPF0246 family)